MLLDRKAMTNLDSRFKSRDITLPTKVCLVKAMVFPVVMYGCESLTVKKAECRRIDTFELWCQLDEGSVRGGAWNLLCGPQAGAVVTVGEAVCNTLAKCGHRSPPVHVSTPEFC